MPRTKKVLCRRFVYGENRSKCGKWVTLVPNSSATVHRTKGWPELLVLGLQRGVNSISLQYIPWAVGCSEWGACLIHWDFEVLKQMAFKVKISKNPFQYVSWDSRYVAVGKLLKRHLPSLHRSLQNFLNVVAPWLVHVYWLWSGSAAVCRTYSWKIDFFGPLIWTRT